MDFIERHELKLIRAGNQYRRSSFALNKEYKKLETKKNRRKLRLLDKQLIKLLWLTNS